MEIVDPITGPTRYQITHAQPDPDCGCRAFADEHDQGFFVSHADYVELENTCSHLIGEYEEMIKTQAADLVRLTKELHARKGKRWFLKRG